MDKYGRDCPTNSKERARKSIQTNHTQCPSRFHNATTYSSNYTYNHYTTTDPARFEGVIATIQSHSTIQKPRSSNMIIVNFKALSFPPKHITDFRMCYVILLRIKSSRLATVHRYSDFLFYINHVSLCVET